MNHTQRITRKQAARVLAATFPAYKGRKITIEVAETVTLYDLNWGDGTKNIYKLVRAADGNTAVVPSLSPWRNTYEGMTYAVPDGTVVVEHSIFCGEDAGIRIYVNPTNAPKWMNA